MWWMINPAAATSIARQQTIDAVRESRRERAARFTPEPDDGPGGRHKAPRRFGAFRTVALHRRLAH